MFETDGAKAAAGDNDSSQVQRGVADQVSSASHGIHTIYEFRDCAQESLVDKDQWGLSSSDDDEMTGKQSTVAAPLAESNHAEVGPMQNHSCPAPLLQESSEKTRPVGPGQARSRSPREDRKACVGSPNTLLPIVTMGRRNTLESVLESRLRTTAH
jgi:hypothetical protein